MKGKEESWWNPSLHAVHHLNLTPGALSNHKIEVEIVKRERKRSIKSRSLEKEPEMSLVIKGYSYFVTTFLLQYSLLIYTNKLSTCV